MRTYDRRLDVKTAVKAMKHNTSAVVYTALDWPREVGGHAQDK